MPLTYHDALRMMLHRLWCIDCVMLIASASVKVLSEVRWNFDTYAAL